VKRRRNGYALQPAAAAAAGPIARPIDPTPTQLPTVRYKLDGAFLPPQIGGWGSFDWALVDRAEMLRRARVALLGDTDDTGIDGSRRDADSEWVNLFTSKRRHGRWLRATSEKFTAENIDAAIARCSRYQEVAS